MIPSEAKRKLLLASTTNAVKRNYLDSIPYPYRRGWIENIELAVHSMASNEEADLADDSCRRMIAIHALAFYLWNKSLGGKILIAIPFSHYFLGWLSNIQIDRCVMRAATLIAANECLIKYGDKHAVA